MSKGEVMPQAVLDSDYMTVQEAAGLLRVDKSTIRRWIADGSLPAYRVGKRRVALKRSDVAALITPARPPHTMSNSGATGANPRIQALTTDEQRQAQAAVTAARRLQAELLSRRGGERFSPSEAILNQLRDARSDELR
jgi:excisionase family DNA binding protein